MLTENKHKCQSAHPQLIFDEACLDVYNLLNDNVTVWGQYNECEDCKFQELVQLGPNSTDSLLVKTRYSLALNYTIGNTTCRVDKLFYEHNRYGWNITEKCGQVYMKEGAAESAYLPILTAFIVLFAFGTLWYMVKGIYKCIKNNERWRSYFVRHTELESDLGSPVAGSSLFIEKPPPLRKHPHRVKSLDVFRGFCIVLMIFVDYGGGQYWFFHHSVWNGITLADLVFPWFLWIMGMSFAISLHNKLRHAVPRREIVFQVMRRSVILIAIGIVLNSHGKTTPLTSLRIPGVLQRLGLCYLFVGVMETTFAKRGFAVNEYGRFNFMQDIIVSLPQCVTMFVLILIHLLITFLLYVPDCGRGYLGPGGLQDQGHYSNCTGGATGYIDRVVFGEHLYKKSTCHVLYETHVYYDPEGILGTLTSIVLVYFGVVAGRIMYTYNEVQTRLFRWSLRAVLLCLIGGALCGFSKNDGVIPLNKNLWSLSFTFVTGGLAFAIQAFLFLVVDILRKWGGRPFFYPGMNSILLYIGHILFKNTFPFVWTPVCQTHAAYLSMNLWGTALWVVISIVLYKNNIFFKL